jgi:hypothetical protein
MTVHVPPHRFCSITEYKCRWSAKLGCWRHKVDGRWYMELRAGRRLDIEKEIVKTLSDGKWHTGRQVYELSCMDFDLQDFCTQFLLEDGVIERRDRGGKQRDQWRLCDRRLIHESILLAVTSTRGDKHNILEFVVTFTNKLVQEIVHEDETALQKVLLSLLAPSYTVLKMTSVKSSRRKSTLHGSIRGHIAFLRKVPLFPPKHVLGFDWSQLPATRDLKKLEPHEVPACDKKRHRAPPESPGGATKTMRRNSVP